MEKPEPNISVPVDLTNPGQFFACCGLLELADRLWPGVEAWFSGNRFLIESKDRNCAIANILNGFSGATVEQIDPSDNAASALRLRVAATGLLLNWWQDEETGGRQLKAWAGRQSGPLIFRLMKAKVSGAAVDDPLGFSTTIFDNKDGKKKKKSISPFYFDSRRAGTSLDVGFSADEQQMSVNEFPVVDAFAMVGIQRFRPQVDESARPRAFLYRAWAEKLAVPVIPGVVAGAVPFPLCGTFRFSKPSRGGEYASMFTRATRERRLL